MKQLFLIIALLAAGFTYGQRVQGTIKPGPQANEVVLAIRPTATFTAQMSVLTMAVQIPTSVGARPTVTFTNLQPALFGSWVQADDDQGDGFYTWSFTCAVPGASNTGAANWTATEMEVLRVNFGGVASTADVRICHYLDGGLTNYAIFYVETSLAAVNNGVLSDWGNLFYTAGAVNGAAHPGFIGVPNAEYSFGLVVNISLPIKFTSFYAYRSAGNGVLNWNVENQNGVMSHFEIERSLNGSNFAGIGRKEVVFTPGGSGNYEFTDAGIFDTHKGNVYYRIKQIDRNGTIAYSAIRIVKPDSKSFGLNIYPNPVNKEANLAFTMADAKPVTIILANVTGTRITDFSMQAQKGINQKKINVSALTAGTYMFIIRTEDESQTVPFVKGN